MTSQSQKPTHVKNTASANGNDLARLRDMLYGNQARESDGRITELEKRIEGVRSQLQGDLTTQFDTLSQQSATNISDLRTHLNEQVAQRFNAGSAGLQAVKQDIGEQINKLEQAQTQQLATLRRDMMAGVETIKRELLAQVQQDRRELASRIDQVSAEQVNRLLTMETEGRARNDVLRQELLTLSAYLDNKKTSRTDLAQMLIDMGAGLKALGQAKTGDERSNGTLVEKS